jgi:hypothetical protein
MRRLFSLSLLLVLGGCTALVDRVKDAVNPVVAFGTLTVVEPPQSDKLDELQDLDPGVGLVLFLANALDANDIDKAPVTGAVVTVAGCDASAVANEHQPGEYSILPGSSDLDGCDGGEMTLTLDRGDGKDPGLVTFDMPVLGGLDIPEEHDANTGMTVPFPDPAPDRILTTVIDVGDQSVSYVDRPETVREWFDFLTGAPMTELTLPAEAFPAESLYAVTIARMKKVPESGYDRMNSTLSTIQVGQTAAYPVETGTFQ